MKEDKTYNILIEITKIVLIICGTILVYTPFISVLILKKHNSMSIPLIIIGILYLFMGIMSMFHKSKGKK